jgi:hypothetical protein
MSDDSIPRPYPGERLNTLELVALHLMTGDEQQIWSVGDLGRELDDPEGAIDAVRGLRTSGLLHQTSDGYVFASRAACRMVEITGRAG